MGSPVVFIVSESEKSCTVFIFILINLQVVLSEVIVFLSFVLGSDWLLMY